jgi:zinc D-Ala-D-Ala carboxypeptidase
MYKYFKLSEFDSPDRPGTGELMEHDVLEALDVARDIAGFPFIVTSGVRTVQHNKAVNGSPRSSHLLGWAADLKVVSTRKRFLMMEALLDAGFNRFGIGKDYIHVDMDPNKDPNVIWTY